MRAALVDAGFDTAGLEARLARYDAVLSLAPGAPSREALSDEEFGACFAELPRVMDDCATALAGAVLLDGRPAGFPEREYCRLSLTAHLMDHLGKAWVAANAFLAGLPGMVEALDVYSNRPALAGALAAKWGRRGVSVQLCAPAAAAARRWGRWRERVARHAAFRVSQFTERLGDRRRRGASEAVLQEARKSKRPVVLMYLQASVNYFVLRRTASVLREAKCAVYYVDWSDDRLAAVEDQLSGSLIRFWSLRAWQEPVEDPLPVVSWDPARCASGGDASLILGAGAELLGQAVQRAAREAVRHGRAHDEIWDAAQPRVIVACEDYLRGSFLNVAAARRSVPTMDVAHAFQHPWQRNYSYRAVALFGEEDVRAQTEREPPPSSCWLAAIGPCRYDDIFFGQHGSESAARAALSLPRETPVVLFASQYLWGGDPWFAALKEQALQWLAEALPAGAVLVVKEHPLETGGMAERVLGAALAAERWRVTRDADLYGLIAASRVMVTLWSNAATEAVLLGKPVLLLDNPQLSILPYVAAGVAARVRSCAELSGRLAGLAGSGAAGASGSGLDRATRAQFIQGHLTAFDGRASERAASLALDLAGLPAAKRLDAGGLSHACCLSLC